MNPSVPRRAGRARRLRALLCALPLALGWPVAAQTPADAAATTPAAPTADESGLATNAPRFDVEVQASDALRPFLLRHLELMRYRDLADLEAAELERLLARTQDNLQDLLGTLGHFAPQIAIEGPLALGPTPLSTVRIRVEPGPVTRIASANVYFRGDIADNPQAAEQREAVRQAFALRAGEPFTQADWSNAKTAALRALTARRYPAGHLYNSLADVDTTDHSVRLAIELDSGPPLTLEGVRIEGAERFDPATVRGTLEQNTLYHIIVQATPRLRAALCAKQPCNGNGVPVELPRIETFRQPPPGP